NPSHTSQTARITSAAFVKKIAGRFRTPKTQKRQAKAKPVCKNAALGMFEKSTIPGTTIKGHRPAKIMKIPTTILLEKSDLDAEAIISLSTASVLESQLN